MSASLPTSLLRAAERRPEAPALAWRGGEWSYGELRNASEGAAQWLTAMDLPRGARIALLLRNSPQYVALYYGVMLAGFVAVPLNAQERANVFVRQIEHCEASLAIGDPGHPEWPALLTKAPALGFATKEIRLAPGAAGLADFHATTSVRAPLPAMVGGDDDLAVIIYTSGTTGRPKGVMLSRRNLAENARSIVRYLELSDADRGLCVLPFHFSYGASVLHTHLLAGAALAIEDNFAFPQATLQRLQDEAITGFAGVPSTFALLLGRCRLDEFDLTRLRYMTQAGGPMPRPLIERLRAQAPGVKLFVMYGQTEATARLTYLPPDRIEAKLGSIGIPVSGVEVEGR